MALETVLDSTTRISGEAQRGMKRLGDSLILLGLPIKASQRDADQSREDDGRNFEEVEEDATEDSNVTPAEAPYENKIWSLWEVEKLVFKSNESTREVLEALQLDSLNEVDARTILKRRVELGS